MVVQACWRMMVTSGLGFGGKVLSCVCDYYGVAACLDCDDVKLRKVFDGIALLRKEYDELQNEKFLAVNSSLNRWHLAAFVRLTWKKYFEILFYAVDIGLAHDGFAFYSERKGYAVLRSGGSYGIVPRAMYSLGKNVVCKKDMAIFEKSLVWKD